MHRCQPLLAVISGTSVAVGNPRVAVGSPPYEVHIHTLEVVGGTCLVAAAASCIPAGSPEHWAPLL